MKKTLITLFLALTLVTPQSFSEESSKEEPPQEMIDFVLFDDRGGEVALSEVKQDNSILLVFWAHWSRESKTHLIDLKEKVAYYKSKGIKIVAVNVDRNPILFASFTKKNKLNFTTLQDPKGIFEDLYEVYFLPTNILIDKENLIVYRGNQLPSTQRIESLG